jgi:hypothetical protein
LLDRPTTIEDASTGTRRGGFSSAMITKCAMQSESYTL